MSEACPDYQPMPCFNLVLACIEHCFKDPEMEANQNNTYTKSYNNYQTANDVKQRRLKFLNGKLVRMALDCSTGIGVHRVTKAAKEYNIC